MLNNTLIHYISFGVKSNKVLVNSVESVRKYVNNPIQIIGDSNLKSLYDSNIIKVDKVSKSNIVNSRYYKTVLNKYQRQYNLYLDADTIIRSVDIIKIFDILENSNFDILITPSKNQDKDLFWHIEEKEREDTINLLGYEPLQLQGGVFAWKANEITDNFFINWNVEYMFYLGQDQAALTRAIYKSAKQNKAPKIYLLSNVFNGGSVINHNFGAIRAE